MTPRRERSKVEKNGIVRLTAVNHAFFLSLTKDNTPKLRGKSGNAWESLEEWCSVKKHFAFEQPAERSGDAGNWLCCGRLVLIFSFV